MSAKSQRVVVLGLGPIGRAAALEILQDPGMELVGAVDPSPAYVGKSLGEVLGVKPGRGKKANPGMLRVSPNVSALRATKFDVAVHMAGSRFLSIVDQLRELVSRGVHVVSTSEELIAASVRWPAQAEALDREARKHEVCVLAAGVNPGFVMDLLPSAVANACVSVRTVRVTRHVDTSKRRRALQEKTGAGLTRAEFTKRLKAGTIGHVGLRDSLLFLLDHVSVRGVAGPESIRPLIASKAVGRGAARIPAGRVIGVHQRVSAKDPVSGKKVAEYDLKMGLHLPHPYDEIRIDGDPPIHLRIEGGIQGDRATVGMVLSTIRATEGARPGLGR